MRRIPASVRYVSAVALAGLAAWAAFVRPPQARRVVDKEALVSAAANPDEWVTYGRDYAETHFSPLNQINDQNVGKLGLAWTWDTESPRSGRVEATPLMQDGVLYGSLTWNVVFAVDARTGRLKWRWDPEIAEDTVRGMCCDPVNRGVALYNGKVYQGMLDGSVVALDQDTGEVVWRTQDTDPDADMTLTSAVRVVRGKLIVGSSGADFGARGYFSAYDAETGQRVWRFYTVPGDPSKPFEHPELEAAAKTWNGEWWIAGGGGTVWDGMAYDPEADLLYVGTGNGSPWNQNYRSPGGGDNLYLASIIAVAPETGRMVWYYQTTPGEMWDYTAAQPLILADITINGRARKVIMQAPKNGFFYVIDRITGEFISGEKFARRVTWATGIDATGRPIEAKGARYTNQAVMISPATRGAHNWHPMSFSPLTGLVYIPGVEDREVYTPDMNYRYVPGYMNTGTSRGSRPDDVPFVAPPKPEGGIPEPEGAAEQPDAGGRFLLALDPATNRERWRLQAPTGGGGGTLATAGNLVFHGDSAYNATTGEKLWTVEGLTNVASPMSYMLDGKQYVAMLAGPIPGNRLLVFALDGTAPLPADLAPGAGQGEGAPQANP